MDILEKQVPEKITTVMKRLKFKNNPIELAGSASLKSQRYPSDYDFISFVPRDKDIFPFLENLMDDKYFIELKLQGKKKVKVFPFEHITKAQIGSLATLDFIKIDLILWLENRFKEVSCIYMFAGLPDSTDYKKSIEKDIAELKSEGNHYKVLKRQFSLSKADGDKKNLLRLTKIFNGEMGEEYQLISNLEAIQKVLEYYPDPETIKRVKLNLKEIKLPQEISDVESWIKSKKDELNKKAKEL